MASSWLTAGGSARRARHGFGLAGTARWLAPLALLLPVTGAPVKAQTVPSSTVRSVPPLAGAAAPVAPAQPQQALDPQGFQQQQSPAIQPLGPVGGLPDSAGPPASGQLGTGTAPLLAGGVQPDLRRVFGDDAPALGGLDVIASLGLSARAAIETEWTDNLPRQSSGEPLSPRFKSKSDFIFRPQIGVDAGRAFGRQQLFVNANFGRDIYARNTILNRTRFSVAGGLGWSLGQRCGGRIQGSWSTRGTQFDQFDEVVPSTQESTGFFANGSCQTAGGLVGSLSYDRSSTRNSVGSTAGGVPDSRAFADTNNDGISTSIGYQLSSRGQAGVQFSWRNVEYPNQLLINGDINANEIFTWTVYGDYRIGSRFQANGSVGQSKVTPRSVLTPSFSGGIYSLGINYSGPRIGGALTFGRNVSASTGGQSNYQIAEYLNANLTYRTNDRMGFVLGYALTEQQNRGNLSIPGTLTDRDYKTNRFFVGGDYRLNRRISFNSDFSYRNRNSANDLLGYDEFTVRLTARAEI